MQKPHGFSLSPDLQEKLSSVKMLALDVDGILTDGRITYDSQGNELKSFNIKDGLGIKLAQSIGIQIAIITGRVSPMVARRCEELGIESIIQGREDKGTALAELSSQSGVPFRQIAYAGDDLPDLRALNAAAVGITVADAHPEVLAVADWVTPLKGGEGAVRQICDALLQSQGQYEQAMEAFR